MKQVKQLDFTGEKIYCGIDVHKNSWKVSIRSENIEFRTFLQPPSVKTLVNHLRKNFPSAIYYAAYEAGFCGFGYQREFIKHGVNCIVVHAADIPTSDKERHQKNDTNDCRKISKCLSEGSLKGIYIPDLQQQNDRHLIRNYKQFIRDRTACKNRIKHWLMFQGVEVSVSQADQKHWPKKFVEYLKALKIPDVSARTSLDLLLRGLDNTNEQVLHAGRALRVLIKQDHIKKNFELLTSVPGIGPLTAIQLQTEIGDINRFNTFDQFCSYLGLIPNMHLSDNKGYSGELTRRGHPMLKTALIECSWRAIKDDPALTKAFSEYCKRMKKNKAIVKICRKLASRIRFVLKNQVPYQKYPVE